MGGRDRGRTTLLDQKLFNWEKLQDFAIRCLFHITMLKRILESLCNYWVGGMKT